MVGLRKRVPVAGPWITEREVRAVAEAAQNDWYGNAGASLRRFETEFAAKIGVKHAIAVPHCTAALHLAMMAFGVGPGDEVVVPESTWIATAAPIQYVGATPVFADIDPVTWCVSAQSIERCITPKTRAIIVVDLYGGTPDMAAISELAKRHGIPVLEDAAQSIGATYHGLNAGALGDIATFSFHGTKTLTTGEGGMLVTDRTDYFERCAFLRDHGRTPEGFKYFVSQELAYKYKMSSLQAAFGIAQLERLDELVARKRQIFAWYEARLEDLPGIQLNCQPPNTFNTYWMVTIVPDAGFTLTNREMMDHLDRHSIDSRPFFPPLSSLPAFAGMPDVARAQSSNPVAYRIGSTGLNLPSALLLDEEQVDYVCSAVREMLGRKMKKEASVR